MVDRKCRWLMLVFVCLIVVSGCTHAISPEMRRRADMDLTISRVREDPSAYTGSLVIWGGVVREHRDIPGGTELKVLERPLSSLGRPMAYVETRGRFVARTQSELDPRVYQRGRKLTTAGELMGMATESDGATSETLPVLQVKELHLWMEETPSKGLPTGRQWYRYYGHPGFRDGSGLGL